MTGLPFENEKFAVFVRLEVDIAHRGSKLRPPLKDEKATKTKKAPLSKPQADTIKPSSVLNFYS